MPGMLAIATCALSLLALTPQAAQESPTSVATRRVPISSSLSRM